ncbi:sodium-coupled neutral amino acid transporter 5b [Lepisosteus oculatus]|uniref:Solute carrier family 38 member 5 n=1 Tax=Lepisosteus oculatus TaxID=7918 RepID=W5NAY8_LEPOC|nr:PREDICTED: sodium-coupled neutral amino acid transporter 5-like [Lepisosteus oculatus]XP_015196229.1 PREDICTED: sodium-coupled neutral amino acid transporter 5-like [Lepisosteus oculatus]XP_015196239.1 PREDICTED: sodium-coupled neutral amino acid transporter 5-like [Lepisosteus oculatus]
MELEKLSGDETLGIISNGSHVNDLSPEKVTLEDGYEGPESAEMEREEFLPHKGDGKKQPQFTDFEGKTSLGMSVFNLSNAIMGSGILGLAYAMSNTGIILFLILLTFIAILSAYSIHLLLKSAGVVGIRAYEQLGNRAFGPPGKILAAIVVSIHNIGAMSSYLFIIKVELPLVISSFLKTDSSDLWYLEGRYLIIIVSVLIILPLALMRQLGYLGYTSGFSLTCMVFFLISVIYKKFDFSCSPEMEMNLTNCVNNTEEVKFFTVNQQTAYTIPILAFAFVCHPEVLPIYTELRRPTKKRMQTVANISILAMFLMYLLTAIFGYLTFYGNVEAELLHTYSKVKRVDTLILCVRLAVLLAVTLTVPVVLFPIRRALQQLLFPGKDFHWGRHCGIAIVLLIIVNLLVIFVPNIKDIFGIIGATSAPSLIFILPGIFYVRIIPSEREPLKSRPKIQAACFAALGFIFMVMSLSFIFVDWVRGESNSHGGH